jgi:uncharacterized membrane protein YcaP (DUF421 family)
VDLNALFGLHVSVLDILLRGSFVYWFLFLLFRFVVRRDVGALGIPDVLLVVLVADAAQNAMAGRYKSITEGMLLVSTIVLWNLAMDRAAYRWPAVDRFVNPRALPLIRHGRLIHENLQRQMLTEEELMARLRLHSVSHPSEVQHAYMESDGEISVIKRRAASPRVDSPE